MRQKKQLYLRALAKEWDKKLKESGFVDIENRSGYFKDHKTLYDLRQRKQFQTIETYEATQIYYQWAREATNHISEMKTIWEYHSEGLTLSEIGEKMGRGKQTIFNKLKKINELLNIFHTILVRD